MDTADLETGPLCHLPEPRRRMTSEEMLAKSNTGAAMKEEGLVSPQAKMETKST